MAKKNFLLGMLVLALALGMTVVGCDNNPADDGGGTFTLTNIPENYNGKYAYYTAIYDTPILAGASSINVETGVITCVKIVNGSVSIPIWVAGNNGYKKFSGNRTVTDSLVMVYNSLAITLESVDNIVAMVEFGSVTFSNGNAVKSWNDGEVDEDW